jgi:hypothetical protein
VDACRLITGRWRLVRKCMSSLGLYLPSLPIADLHLHILDLLMDPFRSEAPCCAKNVRADTALSAGVPTAGKERTCSGTERWINSPEREVST